MSQWKCSVLTLLVFLVMSGAHAQEAQLQLNRSAKGYEYVERPFPSDIMVFDLDKKKHFLKGDGVTLVHVWTMRDGSRADLWGKAREIEQRFKSEGLNSISVNFGNGVRMSQHRDTLADFVQYTQKPEHLYFDTLGYITDLLRVPGFPVYYLVEDNKIVFITLGEDLEGVAILEEEIQKRLADKAQK